jgi:hypothetical protein
MIRQQRGRMIATASCNYSGRCPGCGVPPSRGETVTPVGAFPGVRWWHLSCRKVYLRLGRQQE